MVASYKNRLTQGTAAGGHSPAATVALRQAFVLRGDVEGLTDEIPQLVPLLLEVRAQVVRFFGPDVPVVLELVQNPEAADALPELFAYIQTRLPVPEAKARLEKLDEQWWLDALARGDGRLNVALEYV